MKEPDHYHRLVKKTLAYLQIPRNAGYWKIFRMLYREANLQLYQWGNDGIV
jgi:hypothetical protein